MSSSDRGDHVEEEELEYDEDVSLMMQLDARERKAQKNAKITLVVFGFLLSAAAVAAIVVTILVFAGVFGSTSSSSSYVDRITESRLQTHLTSLQSIADEHDGSRAVHLGFNASQEYVLDQLQPLDHFLNVTVQPFTFTQTLAVAPPHFRQSALGPAGDIVFVDEVDFNVLRDSGSGNLTDVPVFFVGLGCNHTDYAEFPAGHVALTQRGTCSNIERVDAAVNASASAVIIINYDTESEPTPGSVGQVVPLPVVGVTHNGGLLLRAENPRPNVSLDVSNVVQTTYTSNIVADTFSGDENSVIVVGAHLDSVPAGPGINDDGSGTSTLLELAIQMDRSGMKLKNKVRFAWWSAEELGLKGSSAYVADLLENDPEEFDKIAMDLNFDMLASPNYFRALMDGDMCPEDIRAQCITIMDLFGEYFNQQELPFTFTPLNNRSDHGPFLDAGKPVGGVKAGAEQIKTQEQRIAFGGIQNTNLDPCYHKHCDTIDNPNMDIMLQFAKSAAYVLETVAKQEDLREFLVEGGLPDGGRAIRSRHFVPRNYDPREEEKRMWEEL